MVIWRAQLVLVLYILLLLYVFVGFNCNNVYADSVLKIAYERELRSIIKQKPKYVWGGSEDETKGLDCSGYLYLAAKRAGLPVKRTTAKNMYLGFAGWDGINIGVRDTDILDIVWWTWPWKPEREHGHVGIFLLGDKSKLLEVTHASRTHGHVVLEPFSGDLAKYYSGIKRLNCLKRGYRNE